MRGGTTFGMCLGCELLAEPSGAPILPGHVRMTFSFGGELRRTSGGMVCRGAVGLVVALMGKVVVLIEITFMALPSVSTALGSAGGSAWLELLGSGLVGLVVSTAISCRELVLSVLSGSGAWFPVKAFGGGGEASQARCGRLKATPAFGLCLTAEDAFIGMGTRVLRIGEFWGSMAGC